MQWETLELALEVAREMGAKLYLCHDHRKLIPDGTGNWSADIRHYWADTLSDSDQPGTLYVRKTSDGWRLCIGSSVEPRARKSYTYALMAMPYSKTEATFRVALKHIKVALWIHNAVMTDQAMDRAGYAQAGE